MNSMVLDGIDVAALPAEPDVEIDHVVVRLEVELLDVVDIGADDDLGRMARRGRSSDSLGHGAGGDCGGVPMRSMRVRRTSRAEK